MPHKKPNTSSLSYVCIFSYYSDLHFYPCVFPKPCPTYTLERKHSSLVSTEQYAAGITDTAWGAEHHGTGKELQISYL
jgi:hypothetical protein